jgi:hypothetical protein
MSLEQWRKNSWLREDPATVEEIKDLLAVVDREIADASVAQLSTDGRFMHAYDAALNLCAIALRVSGYAVPKGSNHHKRTIGALPLVLGNEYQVISDQIELASRLRGQAMYDRAEVVRLGDAEELAETARDLRASVLSWIKREHPNLYPLAKN